MPRRHWVVAGRVQGGWFRESTRRHVEALGGLRGWVRNLEDGRVEVMAEGELNRLEDLRNFLTQGPDLACVERVTEMPVPPELEGDGFRITR